MLPRALAEDPPGVHTANPTYSWQSVFRDLEASPPMATSICRDARARQDASASSYATLNEHRVGERVLRSSLLPPGIHSTKNGDRIDVGVDGLPRAADPAKKRAPSQENLGARPRWHARIHLRVARSERTVTRCQRPLHIAELALQHARQGLGLDLERREAGNSRSLGGAARRSVDRA